MTPQRRGRTPRRAGAAALLSLGVAPAAGADSTPVDDPAPHRAPPAEGATSGEAPQVDAAPSGGLPHVDAAPTGGLPHVDAAPTGPSAAERLAEIQRRVQAAVVYPAIARKRSVEGTVDVSFRIAQDGRPGEVRVARSSGSATLDRAAERAVRDAAPLPRLLGRVTVPVRFSLHED